MAADENKHVQAYTSLKVLNAHRQSYRFEET